MNLTDSNIHGSKVINRLVITNRHVTGRLIAISQRPGQLINLGWSSLYNHFVHTRTYI
ncbi:hypothetical protein Zm00014a_015034 [Zea mays]|uniref:Uncharacterized protein n=1 Tax=Zea mays TaxID=4577 RepID=A0A3L6G6Q5_MAIZE|nr:hypothetical protein Zm00014a_015034 [Zea mays]